MRRLGTIGVWFLAGAYGLTLGAALDATLRAGSRGAETIVLAPVEGDPARVTETRGDVEIRRMCAAGRCELLAGHGGGFALLASYPADRWVELEGTDRLHVRSIARTPGGWRPLVAPRWILAGSLGAFLAGVLLGRGRRLRARLAALRRSRPAIVEDGVLHFTDAATPRRALPCEALPEGRATGLRQAWSERGGDAPYRDRVTARWVALAGDRDRHLAAAGASWGAHAALTTAVALGTTVVAVAAWLV